MPHLSKIFIHPVKSFQGISLESVKLANGEGLPDDRRYAITNGISDAGSGEWRPCRTFLINAVNDGLLKFNLERTGDAIRLVSPEGCKILLRPDDPQSIADANLQMAQFVASLGPDHAMTSPVITERTQSTGSLSGYWDFTDSAVSIMNAASFEAVAKAAGTSLDIRRLRGNLIVEGLSAWQEFSFLGKRIRIGEAELEIIRPAQRCPSPSVNPETGERDVKVPDIMMEHFGHAFCGIYARVVKDGKITPGAPVEVLGDADLALETAANPAAPDYKLWPKMAKIVARQADKQGALITISASGPWPLPDAVTGQRMRLHLGQGLIGVAKVMEHRAHTTVLHVEQSKSGDPATAYLLATAKVGDQLIVTGPFGRG